MTQVKIGIIASGSDWNAETIMEACESGILVDLAEVAVLICNKMGAYCLERAKNHNVPGVLVESEGFKGIREEYDQRVVEILTNKEVNLVCLAGYMRIVTPFFLQQFPTAVLNIHPALSTILPRHARPPRCDRLWGQSVRLHGTFCRRGRGSRSHNHPKSNSSL